MLWYRKWYNGIKSINESQILCNIQSLVVFMNNYLIAKPILCAYHSCYHYYL